MEMCNRFLLVPYQGTSDEVIDWSHGKQLWELCNEKYEPLWISGGGHCNLELYPEFLKQLKKFVQTLGKSKSSGTNGLKKSTVESDNQSKQSESGTSDTFELGTDLPEVSRNSLDSRLEKTKKSNKPEKSRMSTDRVDRPHCETNANSTFFSFAVKLPSHRAGSFHKLICDLGFAGYALHCSVYLLEPA
ncbi:hypothetical protein FEM48_Zijuj04G0185700 [Ziziphus jujuba var. spinosa]|uniref:Uncharacterized protein n=1 Tax=Ziziphus jujuba var. spinosa TaxID=714518 RepID=A0A978VLH8_ZIZJJ|nr:hypothetical protein FEM48_Zijuj04G0185700 [Ziziphus jujuba var. spinosa]